MKKMCMNLLHKWNVLAILFVAMMCVLAVSCSKDSNNDEDSSIAKEIVGTWYASDTKLNRTCTVTFRSDKTGELFSEYHGTYGHSNSEMTGTFTWKCEGNKVITYGKYVYIDYNDGTVDTDYDPEVIYIYDGSNLTGGRYQGDASIYTKTE